MKKVTFEEMLESMSARLHLIEAENESLKMDAQESRAIANRAMLENTVSSNSLPYTKEPRVCLPDKFDGTRKNFRGFINQLELVFQLQSDRYNTDQKMIATLGTLLTGNALAWQGNQSCSVYVASFHQLTADLDWNDSALRAQFYFGLSYEIKTPWSTSTLLPLLLLRSVRMRSTDSDRSVRATPKKARDVSPPPQDDLWVVVKNLIQQFAAQQTELDALRNTIALQQKATANLEKILSNMASQAASTGEATQAALAAILARLEVGPVVPQVVTSKDTRFADAVKKRPTHQQLVERQPDFRKAGAAAWLALKRETSVPAHSAPKVELSSGLRLIYASGFPYAKPGDLRKAIQGARIRTAQNFFRSLLASIGGKTLEAATVEATKIRVQTPNFSISTLETVPKESLPVKKVTEQEPAAPAVDPSSEMAAEVTPAIQDDGVTPTVTPIADVEMCL
ncbi:hypothetical protein BASA81_017755 [Batrachochytrium salamandrivorans]|nr:hypothetical protein BASA81_017755 [Batrachochytrium salamandrivorans]